VQAGRRTGRNGSRRICRGRTRTKRRTDPGTRPTVSTHPGPGDPERGVQDVQKRPSEAQNRDPDQKPREKRLQRNPEKPRTQ